MNPIRTIALILCLIGAAVCAFADDEYRIGPKDVLQIHVFGEEDLSKQVIVGPDGTIRFPLLREVQIGGLTVRGAVDLMEKQLGERYLVDPNVSISVKEYNSQKVYVLGAVKTPGYYSLTGETTLLEIISTAGGITEAGGKQLIIVRGGAQNPDAVSKLLAADNVKTNVSEDFTRNQNLILVDGHRLLDQGDTSLNKPLMGGDIVYVPKVRKVFVMGEVKRPGGIPYSEGLTLLQAVTLAGGLTEMGKKKVQVKRVVNGAEEKFKVNLKSIIKDIKKDIPLMANDVIVVPRRIF
jgi:polysaccharide biosynthesis/export protein